MATVELIEEVKVCPVCDMTPDAETYHLKGFRYRCRGCGDSSELCSTLAGATENWNAGVTDEYIAEVKEVAA